MVLPLQTSTKISCHSSQGLVHLPNPPQSIDCARHRRSSGQSLQSTYMNSLLCLFGLKMLQLYFKDLYRVLMGLNPDELALYQSTYVFWHFDTFSGPDVRHKNWISLITLIVMAWWKGSIVYWRLVSISMLPQWDKYFCMVCCTLTITFCMNWQERSHCTSLWNGLKNTICGSLLTTLFNKLVRHQWLLGITNIVTGNCQGLHLRMYRRYSCDIYKKQYDCGAYC